MRHTKDFLSRQRQKLLQDAENKEKEAIKLEHKQTLLPFEKEDNLNKAKTLREEANKCRRALVKLRSGSKAQQLAGFSQDCT